MEIKRIFDLLENYKQQFPDKPDVIAGKDNGVWIKFSINQYIEKANNVSYGLMALGVKKGDTIASITFNRPEWNIIDMGIQQIGAIHIPIYPNISDSDYLYILNHAEVKYIFVAGEEMYRRIKHIIQDIPTLKTIYTFRNLHGFEHLNELIEFGKNNKNKKRLDEIKNSLTENDIATIIYTSGTTGTPKGVVLKHKNIISNFTVVSYILPYGPESRALSFLPICHIFERMVNYLFQYRGISIYFAENLGTVMDNIKEVKPQVMTTVPRLLEKIYERILFNGKKLKGIKKIIFYWALNIGQEYNLYKENGWFYELKLSLARKLVFKKWEEALGGIDLMVSGGAALQPRLNRIFWAAGFRILEGYGLSETSPVIAVNTLEPNGCKFGTVGEVIKNTIVKIAPDGEILCKGPCIMDGYFKHPEQTSQVIDQDGWFHTGDIGEFDGTKLKITGRKKEIFKTSFGKYISPQLLENKFKESQYIDNLLVVGENQKFAAAIIAPDFTLLREWCEEQGIVYTTHSEMIRHPEIKKLFEKEIEYYNKFFGDAEQIKRFELVDNEWSVESGDLTATLKLRRTYMSKKYACIIQKLF